MARPFDHDPTSGFPRDARRDGTPERVERGEDDPVAQDRGLRGGDDRSGHDDGHGDAGRRHVDLPTVAKIVRDAGLHFSSDGGAFFAQALAFNAIFAVFPLAILIVASFGFIYGDAKGQAYAMSLFHSLAPNLQESIAENLHQAIAFRGVSGALAIVALAWSGKNLFQGLAYALNRALDVPAGRSLAVDILVALVMLPGLGLAFVVATAVPIAISFVVRAGGFRDAVAWTQIAGYGTSVVLIFVIAMVLYVYLPNRKVGLGFGVPGALAFTAAWELSQIAFAIYTTHVNYAHVYGALATFALLLVWFYYMATIFLFGAEISAQWAKRLG